MAIQAQPLTPGIPRWFIQESSLAGRTEGTGKVTRTVALLISQLGANRNLRLIFIHTILKKLDNVTVTARL